MVLRSCFAAIVAVFAGCQSNPQSFEELLTTEVFSVPGGRGGLVYVDTSPDMNRAVCALTIREAHADKFWMPKVSLTVVDEAEVETESDFVTITVDAVFDPVVTFQFLSGGKNSEERRDSLDVYSTLHDTFVIAVSWTPNGPLTSIFTGGGWHRSGFSIPEFHPTRVQLFVSGMDGAFSCKS